MNTVSPFNAFFPQALSLESNPEEGFPAEGFPAEDGLLEGDDLDGSAPESILGGSKEAKNGAALEEESLLFNTSLEAQRSPNFADLLASIVPSLGQSIGPASGNFSTPSKETVTKENLDFLGRTKGAQYMVLPQAQAQAQVLPLLLSKEDLNAVLSKASQAVNTAKDGGAHGEVSVERAINNFEKALAGASVEFEKKNFLRANNASSLGAAGNGQSLQREFLGKEVYRKLAPVLISSEGKEKTKSEANAPSIPVKEFILNEKKEGESIRLLPLYKERESQLSSNFSPSSESIDKIKADSKIEKLALNLSNFLKPKILSSERVAVSFEHHDLGKLELEIQKDSRSGELKLEIKSSDKDSVNFLRAQKGPLLAELEQKGLKFSDLKVSGSKEQVHTFKNQILSDISAKKGEEGTFRFDNSDKNFSSDRDSLGEKGPDRSQARAGDEGEGRERREELWKQYRLYAKSERQV